MWFDLFLASVAISPLILTAAVVRRAAISATSPAAPPHR